MGKLLIVSFIGLGPSRRIFRIYIHTYNLSFLISCLFFFFSVVKPCSPLLFCTLYPTDRPHLSGNGVIESRFSRIRTDVARAL